MVKCAPECVGKEGGKAITFLDGVFSNERKPGFNVRNDFSFKGPSVDYLKQFIRQEIELKKNWMHVYSSTARVSGTSENQGLTLVLVAVFSHR